MLSEFCVTHHLTGVMWTSPGEHIPGVLTTWTQLESEKKCLQITMIRDGLTQK